MLTVLEQYFWLPQLGRSPFLVALLDPLGVHQALPEILGGIRAFGKFRQLSCPQRQSFHDLRTGIRNVGL